MHAVPDFSSSPTFQVQERRHHGSMALRLLNNWQHRLRPVLGGDIIPSPRREAQFASRHVLLSKLNDFHERLVTTI
jgi:hypothetical protein